MIRWMKLAPKCRVQEEYVRQDMDDREMEEGLKHQVSQPNIPLINHGNGNQNPKCWQINDMMEESKDLCKSLD